MDVCTLSPDAVVGFNRTDNSTLLLSDFNASRRNMEPCGAPTYLRPDPGGCLLPWPYTMAWILIHLPVTVLRVTRWEKVQALSIILAFFSVYFTVQAYTTHLVPDQVMVWMPLAVVLDIGAMMQLVFLIVEENGIALLWSAFRESIVRPFSRHNAGDVRFPGRREQTAERSKTTPVRVVSLGPEPVPADRGLIGQAWLTVLALMLLITLLVLQLIGLALAAKGRNVENLKARWCSPMFQSAESTLVSCDTAPLLVDKSASQGIGCISLPADEQYHWLRATVAVLSLSLVFELFDGAILVMVGNNTRWWRARMKRPWFTMFTGNAVLLCILIVGVVSSSQLPSSVNRVVWVFKYEQSLHSAVVCRGTLISAGVRGSIIGWTDGFLQSWGKTYGGS
ncbi:hypothetical protein CkaCkLH20_04450 [Colletotrichum karsti]|uniref:Uncharacterized protein n=1 Tax=Colletotrichum karsti TaxID=1095194 RepID=A0A9P6LJ11_9PEZI|nr:uncharacterized protein CkaCkLH20_04450 [Colletotrichum karsti]KAF9877874.1 hypothetical protein CkaCkLH20_04450 [Colletotrichum karsti]